MAVFAGITMVILDVLFATVQSLSVTMDWDL